MVIICREVNRTKGETCSYVLNIEVTHSTLSNLSIRSRYNPELSYFATTRTHFDDNKEAIIYALGQPKISQDKISEIGNLIQL